MSNLSDLVDVGHWYGGDLIIGATGDLASVTRVTRSQQRVLRRLLTAPGDYLAHPDYGAGLPSQVGENLDERRVTGIIRNQMRREESVVRTPEPTVALLPILNGVRTDINYVVAPGAIPAVVSFDVSNPT
jgi:hypothetical protein